MSDEPHCKYLLAFSKLLYHIINVKQRIKPTQDEKSNLIQEIVCFVSLLLLLTVWIKIL